MQTYVIISVYPVAFIMPKLNPLASTPLGDAGDTSPSILVSLYYA